MVDEEEMAAASAATAEGKEYLNTSDPSILRFLIAAREEVDSVQVSCHGLVPSLIRLLAAGQILCLLQGSPLPKWALP